MHEEVAAAEVVCLDVGKRLGAGGRQALVKRLPGVPEDPVTTLDQPGHERHGIGGVSRHRDGGEEEGSHGLELYNNH